MLSWYFLSCWVLFGNHPQGSSGLLRALCPGISPGGVQGTISGDGDQTWGSVACKASTLTPALSRTCSAVARGASGQGAGVRASLGPWSRFLSLTETRSAGPAAAAWWLHIPLRVLFAGLEGEGQRTAVAPQKGQLPGAHSVGVRENGAFRPLQGKI